ncbi:hypothetical protein ABZY90_02095 [Streptomyces sp. NPDC006422]|uniref:hypothetical protein n=1 Tax=unclassified Streptomyces TaxID=2593676 RepID=UPI0033A5579A
MPAPTTAQRWAAFSCVLVPLVLVWCGSSAAGAAGAAWGLVAVTAACRVLLRQAERGAAQLHSEQCEARRDGAAATAAGARIGGPRAGWDTPVD